jgi:hypothetical protein
MMAWILSFLAAICVLLGFVALAYLGQEAVGATIAVMVIATIIRITVFSD